MRSNSTSGVANIFLLLFIVSALLLVCSASFAVWAFSSRQDYKNNSDAKAADAVAAAEQSQRSKLNAEFIEKEKSPNKTYTSSATYGSISFSYPKTWSVYIDDSSSSPILGYFKPDFVPALKTDTTYALKVELLNRAYDQEVKRYDSQIKSGQVKVVAYVPEKLKGQANVQVGVRLEGELNTKKPGAMVILKVRDKTLKISTDGSDYINDFNSIVLPSLTFAP